MNTKLLAAALVSVSLVNAAGAASPPETVDATIPIEVLAIDPALATGAIATGRQWSAPKIAMQPARAARGAVLAGKQEVLLLALLEPVEKTAAGTARLDGPPERIAWCELPRFIGNFVSCYQDLDADGKFETSRTGLMGTDEVLALGRVREPKTIEPIAYRAAQASELPQFQVGYRACGNIGDKPRTIDGELRYETVVRRAEGLQWPKSGRCDSIAQPLESLPDGGRLFSMGRFKVEVRPGTEELPTRLVEGMPPGTLLAHVRSSWPLIDATERQADSAAISGDTPYLVAVGTPIIPAHANAGEQVFSLEVRHGLTGKLSVDSEPRSGSDKIRLPAGTPLYGVAMGSSQTPYYDDEVVWCTPVKPPDKPVEAYCFAPHLGGAKLVRTYGEPYTVTGLTVSGKYRDVPVVERGPADFGAPLELVIKVTGADKKKVSIAWSLAPRGQWFASEWSMRRARDDAAFVLVGALLLKITPAADLKSFEVTPIGELAPGDPLHLPMDATRLR